MKQLLKIMKKMNKIYNFLKVVYYQIYLKGFTAWNMFFPMLPALIDGLLYIPFICTQ